MTGVDPLVAAVLAQQAADTEEFDEELRKQQEELNNQTGQAAMALLQGLSNRRNAKNQLPEEINELVTLLQRNPLLIPNVTAYAKAKLAVVQQALDDILAIKEQ